MDADNSSVDIQDSTSTLIDSLEANSPPPIQIQQPNPPQPPSNSSSSSSSDQSDNDELQEEEEALHDEHADSDNEEWLLRHLSLRSQSPSSPSPSEQSSPSQDTTDRVSCPRCFVTLSLQCQRHVSYEGQFRSLFVRNCRVDVHRRCTAQIHAHGGSGSKNGITDVLCEICDTRVGVKEIDTGVYHFCNVIY